LEGEFWPWGTEQKKIPKIQPRKTQEQKVNRAQTSKKIDGQKKTTGG